jgi:hypothetical protein
MRRPNGVCQKLFARLFSLSRRRRHRSRTCLAPGYDAEHRQRVGLDLQHECGRAQLGRRRLLQGPRDVRSFLYENRFFAALWWLVVTGIARAIFTDVVQWPALIGIPLSLLAGGAVWFAFMFGFAHGWIAEGD